MKEGSSSKNPRSAKKRPSSHDRVLSEAVLKSISPDAEGTPAPAEEQSQEPEESGLIEVKGSFRALYGSEKKILADGIDVSIFEAEGKTFIAINVDAFDQSAAGAEEWANALADLVGAETAEQAEAALDSAGRIQLSFLFPVEDAPYFAAEVLRHAEAATAEAHVCDGCSMELAPISLPRGLISGIVRDLLTGSNPQVRYNDSRKAMLKNVVSRQRAAMRGAAQTLNGFLKREG